MDGKDDKDILILFVTIFDTLLSSPVKFPQARPLPLIFHAIFDKDNHFKKGCIAFLKHFQLFDSWNNIKKGSTGSNKVSAEDRFNSFRLCLQEIITKKQITNAILPPMLPRNIWMIDEAHLQCKIHYERVIKKFLIHWESKENCHDSEKLSKIQVYTDIISTYHHNNMEFFTINKSMVSSHTRLFPITLPIASNQIIPSYQVNDGRDRDGYTDNMSNKDGDEDMITVNYDGKSESIQDQQMYNHTPITPYSSNRTPITPYPYGSIPNRVSNSSNFGSNGYSSQYNQTQHVQSHSNMIQLTHTHSTDCVFCSNQQHHDHHYHSNQYQSQCYNNNEHDQRMISKNRSHTMDGSNVEFNNKGDCRSYQQSECPSTWKYTNDHLGNHNNPSQINQMSWRSQQDTNNLNYLQNQIANTSNTPNTPNTSNISMNTGSNPSNVSSSHNSNMSNINYQRNNNMNSNNTNIMPNYSQYQYQQVSQQPPNQIPRQHSYPSTTTNQMNHHQYQQHSSPNNQIQQPLPLQNPQLTVNLYQNQQQQPVAQNQNTHSVHQQQAVLQPSQWMNNNNFNNNNNNSVHHPMNPNMSTSGSDVFAANNSDFMDTDDAISTQTIQSHPNYIHGVMMPLIQSNDQYGYNRNMNIDNNSNSNPNPNPNNI